jgi:hypothetical protein
MYENINEKIDIVAIFGKELRDVKPFRIRWKGREYTIESVDYVHRVKKGDKVFYYFSCTDGINFFELQFDSSDLGWFINKVWDENPD